MNERGSGHTGVISGQLEPTLFLPWGYLKEEHHVGDFALVGGVALPLELSSPGQQKRRQLLSLPMLPERQMQAEQLVA